MKRKIFIIAGLLLLVSISAFSCQATPQSTDLHFESNVTAPSHIQSETELSSGVKLIVEAAPLTNASTYKKVGYAVNALNAEEIQRIYSALCGTAQPKMILETAPELYAYWAYASEMIDYLKVALPPEEYAALAEIAVIIEDDVLHAAKNNPQTRENADLADILDYNMGLVCVELGKPMAARFQVLRDPRWYVHFRNFGLPNYTDVPHKEPLRMHADDATGMALDCLNQMGLSDAFSLSRLDKIPFEESIFDTFLADDAKPEIYRLRFLRDLEGAKQLDNSRITLGTRKSYDEHFFQEYIEFLMDDSGILAFTWQTPSKITDASEAVDILLLDDALRIMQERLDQTYNAFKLPGVDTFAVEIRIEKIMLGYICDPMTQTFIPAWEFYGCIADTSGAAERYFNLDTESWDESYADNTSICTIDATTGRIINRIGE